MLDLINKLKLPKENINIILEYLGYKLRNGIYMKQLDKNMLIYKILNDTEKISNGSVELIVKWIKRKHYCCHKIIISYDTRLNNLRGGLYELDFDDSFHEVNYYYNYTY